MIGRGDPESGAAATTRKAIVSAPSPVTTCVCPTSSRNARCAVRLSWRGIDMRRIFLMSAVTALVSLIAMPALGANPFRACSSTNQCASDEVCKQVDILPWKECQVQACNVSAPSEGGSGGGSTQCPSSRPFCQNGICVWTDNATASASSGPGASSPGVPPGSEGGRCGRIKYGNVIKSRGCNKGLYCQKAPRAESGICAKLQT